MAALMKGIFFPSAPSRHNRTHSYLPVSSTAPSSIDGTNGGLDDEEDDNDEVEKSADSLQHNSHSTTRLLADATIGLSDGLTVPFALTAGLSSLASTSTSIVIYGGFAELIAGSISMGLGGYLAARGELQSYMATRQRTARLVRDQPSHAADLVKGTLSSSFPGMSDTLAACVQTHVCRGMAPVQQVEYLMKFHHDLPEPSSMRPYASALTIAAGYFFGGFLPLLPYLVFTQDVQFALIVSAVVMSFALFAFGAGKAMIDCAGDFDDDGNGKRKWRWKKCTVEGLRMVGMGGAAAGGSWLVVRGLERGAT